MKIWMAPAGLHIEPAAMRDVDALAKLHAAAFYRGWPREDFSTLLGDPDVRTLVVVDKRRAVLGFALIRLAADEAELLTIVIDKKWRGKKLGLALLRAAFDDLLMSPATAMFLEVDETNAPAIRLYSGLGFAEVGRRRGYYPKPDGTPATALVMRAKLG